MQSGRSLPTFRREHIASILRAEDQTKQRTSKKFGLYFKIQWLLYRMYDRGIGVRFPAGARDFSFLHSTQIGSWDYPASYPMCSGESFSGDKATRAWSWPLTPSSAEVKNSWSYTSTTLYVLVAWCLLKHGNNLICFFFCTLTLSSLYQRSLSAHHSWPSSQPVRRYFVTPEVESK
jgi:hypothetical protein